MRVSNNLISDTVTGNLMKSLERIQKTQNVISSGKRVTKPSDDPIAIGNILEFRKKIASIDQYGRNIQYGRSWLGTSDAVLGSVDTLLIRAKELAVYQSSETASETTRAIASEEVKNIFDQLIQLANTKSGGRYIFAGHQTDKAPFSRDGNYNASYAGDTGEINTIIGEDVGMAINVDGEDVFDNTADIFGMLKALKDGLETNDTDAISNQIGQLDMAMTQVQNERAKIGARINRLDATENHWNNFKVNTQEMLYETEDADLIKAMTDLKTMETAYQAALAATASIIQPSLVQYLT